MLLWRKSTADPRKPGHKPVSALQPVTTRPHLLSGACLLAQSLVIPPAKEKRFVKSIETINGTTERHCSPDPGRGRAPLHTMPPAVR